MRTEKTLSLAGTQRDPVMVAAGGRASYGTGADRPREPATAGTPRPTDQPPGSAVPGMPRGQSWPPRADSREADGH